MGNQIVKCCFLQMKDCLMPSSLTESYVWSSHFTYVVSLPRCSLSCCTLTKSEDALWERELIGKIPHFNVFRDAKQDLFSFLKLVSTVQKQFSEKKKITSRERETPFMFSFLHLCGKGLLPTITGFLTCHCWRNVPLQRALHAGGVLFCGHFSHTVEPVVWIRRRQAQQACLPGVCWRGNLCQPPAESPNLQRAAHISWLPWACSKCSNNQHRSPGCCGTRSGKRSKNFKAQAKMSMERNWRGKSCPWSRGWTNNSAAPGRELPDRGHWSVWDRLPLPWSAQLNGVRSIPAPSFHLVWFPQF